MLIFSSNFESLFDSYIYLVVVLWVIKGTDSTTCLKMFHHFFSQVTDVCSAIFSAGTFLSLLEDLIKVFSQLLKFTFLPEMDLELFVQSCTDAVTAPKITTKYLLIDGRVLTVACLVRNILILKLKCLRKKRF